MQRVDKGRGAKCEMLPATKESCEEVVRKLERLKLWANYFDVETHLATRSSQLGTTRPAFRSTRYNYQIELFAAQGSLFSVRIRYPPGYLTG
jgi:hypothetical protein